MSFQNNNGFTCPKCQSRQICKIPGIIRPKDSRNNVIPCGKFGLEEAEISRYLCVDCGYSEEWIENPEHRQALVEEFGLLEQPELTVEEKISAKVAEISNNRPVLEHNDPIDQQKMDNAKTVELDRDMVRELQTSLNYTKNNLPELDSPIDENESECLACGNIIKAHETRCSECGWSYIQ